jgi:hypothetical protein
MKSIRYRLRRAWEAFRMPIPDGCSRSWYNGRISFHGDRCLVDRPAPPEEAATRWNTRAGPRIPEPDTPEEAALRLAHRRAEADLTWALTIWACERWRDEVSNRPMGNIHRRTLDDTWRQVLRHLGADDVALLGPAHDDIAALHGESRNDG